MTGYRLEPTIVGWRSDFADNPHQDRRFTIVHEDGRTLHYPHGQRAAELMRGIVSAWPFVCHEPDYIPTGVGDAFGCRHCGHIVHPITELR